MAIRTEGTPQPDEIIATPTYEERWNSWNFEEMAELWELSDKERQDMKELQSIICDINHWKNDPYEVVRYYREYRTVEKAAHMFRRMVEWRLENDVDSFMERYGDPPPLFHYLPTFLCEGMDRDGDPIYVDRTGAADPYGLVLAYGIEALAEYNQFIRELTTSRRTTPSGPYCWQRDYYEPLYKRRVTQFTVIMDMQDLAPRHMRGGLLGLLKRVVRISQDMYSGFGKRVIIYRAPAIFEWGWNHIVKHFFDQRIREIITITSPEDYLQLTEKYIDLEVLPECMAPGTGKGKAMPGYFENVRLEGGMLPDRNGPVTKDHFALTETDKENLGLSSGNVNTSARLLFRGQWDTEDQVDPSKGGAQTQISVFAMQN